MIVQTHAVLGVLYACVLYFCICNSPAQLSMFHMERRSRNSISISSNSSSSGNSRSNDDDGDNSNIPIIIIIIIIKNKSLEHSLDLDEPKQITTQTTGCFEINCSRFHSLIQKKSTTRLILCISSVEIYITYRTYKHTNRTSR